MIVRSKTSKMGIDWRLAYEELRRITQMMKLGFAKGKKKKGKGRHGSRCANFLCGKLSLFSYLSVSAYFVGTQKICLIKTVLLSTHNICFR